MKFLLALVVSGLMAQSYNFRCPINAKDCRTTEYQYQSGESVKQTCWYDSFLRQYKCKED